MSFLASGGLLILLGLAYLGVVVILMMVMEMIIMAVFMVAYMMNPAGLMPMTMVSQQARLAGHQPSPPSCCSAAGIFAVPWPHRAGAPPRERRRSSSARR